MKGKFDLTTAFTLKGDWFLPEKPEERLSGEFSFHPEEGMRLELIGDFNFNPLGLDNSSYETILGVVEGSRQISLFGCFLIQGGGVTLVKGSETAKPVLTFVVNLMVDGWYFSTKEEICAKTVLVEIDGLAEWLCVTGFKFDDLKLDYAEHTVDLHYKLPEPIPFEYPAGVEASFDFCVNNLSQPIFRTSFEMTQTARLKLKTDKGLSYHDILQAVYKFQCFLMLCSYGEHYIKRISIFNPDYSVDLGIGKPVSRQVDLYFNQHFTVKETKWDSRNMLVPYPAIRNEFPQLILLWDKIFADFEPAINLLVEQLRDTNGFSDNDFLNLAQAAETIHDRMYPGAVKMPPADYDKLKANIVDNVPADCKDFVKGLLQFGNNVSLATRLGDLVKRCPDSILKVFIGAPETFIKEIRDSRNYYTHYTLSGKKHVKRHYELMKLSQQIQFLLVNDLLLHIGVEEDLLDCLIHNQEYRFGQLKNR